MSANAESQAQGGGYLGDERACWRCPQIVPAQMKECRAGGLTESSKFWEI